MRVNYITAIHYCKESPMETAKPPAKISEKFAFEARVFRLPDAYFALADGTGTAAFFLPLGGFSACVPLGAMRQEFGIEPDSPDAQLLCRVEQALHHIDQVRHGDSIPQEIIDGSASWSFEQQHHDIARGRLWFALMHQAGLADEAEPPASRLVSYADNPAVLRQKDAILERLANAADGKDRDSQAVEKIIARQASEYAYIEALGEHCRQIFELRLRFEKAAENYGGAPEGVAEYNRILALCQSPLRQLCASFKMARNLLQNVEAFLQNPDEVIQAIRDLRDELHVESKKWQPLVDAWNHAPADEREQVERRRQTYRFLAQGWAHGEDWEGQSASSAGI